MWFDPWKLHFRYLESISLPNTNSPRGKSRGILSDLLRKISDSPFWQIFNRRKHFPILGINPGNSCQNYFEMDFRYIFAKLIRAKKVLRMSDANEFGSRLLSMINSAERICRVLLKPPMRFSGFRDRLGLPNFTETVVSPFFFFFLERRRHIWTRGRNVLFAFKRKIAEINFPRWSNDVIFWKNHGSRFLQQFFCF